MDRIVWVFFLPQGWGGKGRGGGGKAGCLPATLRRLAATGGRAAAGRRERRRPRSRWEQPARRAGPSAEQSLPGRRAGGKPRGI